MFVNATLEMPTSTLRPPPRHLCSMVLWTPVTPKNATPGAGISTRLVVFGGAQDYASLTAPALADVWLYSLDTRVWTHLETHGALSLPRFGHVASLCGDAMFVFGGRTALQAASNDLLRLDLETGSWTTVTPHPSEWPRARLAPAAVQLSCNVVVLTGGLLFPLESTRPRRQVGGKALDSSSSSGSTLLSDDDGETVDIDDGGCNNSNGGASSLCDADTTVGFADDVFVCVWGAPSADMARCTPVPTIDIPAQAFGQLIRGPADNAHQGKSSAQATLGKKLGLQRKQAEDLRNGDELLGSVLSASPNNNGSGNSNNGGSNLILLMGLAEPTDDELAPTPRMSMFKLGCPAGYAAPAVTLTGCIPCAPGTYMTEAAAASPQANRACTPCPNGTTTSAADAKDPLWHPTSVHDCSVCNLPCQALVGTCVLDADVGAFCVCAPLWGGEHCGLLAILFKKLGFYTMLTAGFLLHADQPTPAFFVVLATSCVAIVLCMLSVASCFRRRRVDMSYLGVMGLPYLWFGFVVFCFINLWIRKTREPAARFAALPHQGGDADYISAHAACVHA
jgi:hypothetical protein